MPIKLRFRTHLKDVSFTNFTGVFSRKLCYNYEVNDSNFNTAISKINQANKILIVQAENPDGDSLASSLALEEIFGDLNKEVFMHCPVEIPKYLRYMVGWDRVNLELEQNVDLVIIVDTSSETLLSKTLSYAGARHFLNASEILVFDHHHTDSNLTFTHQMVELPDAVATGEVIFKLAKQADWQVNKKASEHLLTSIMSDSLGLTTQNTTANSFLTCGELVKLGAKNYEIESRRREFMKKSKEIFAYKADLMSRVEFLSNNRIAFIHVTWNEIEKYSDQYNPSALVIDEMRLINDVELSVAFKTYPDGKITGKLRGNIPVCETIAGFFGGGGHIYASGFRTYGEYSEILAEFEKVATEAIDKYKSEEKNETV